MDHVHASVQRINSVFAGIISSDFHLPMCRISTVRRACVRGDHTVVRIAVKSTSNRLEIHEVAVLMGFLGLSLHDRTILLLVVILLHKTVSVHYDACLGKIGTQRRLLPKIHYCLKYVSSL